MSVNLGSFLPVSHLTDVVQVGYEFYHYRGRREYSYNETACERGRGEVRRREGEGRSGESREKKDEWSGESGVKGLWRKKRGNMME